MEKIARDFGKNLHIVLEEWQLERLLFFCFLGPRGTIGIKDMISVSKYFLGCFGYTWIADICVREGIGAGVIRQMYGVHYSFLSKTMMDYFFCRTLLIF